MTLSMTFNGSRQSCQASPDHDDFDLRRVRSCGAVWLMVLGDGHCCDYLAMLNPLHHVAFYLYRKPKRIILLSGLVEEAKTPT